VISASGFCHRGQLVFSSTDFRAELLSPFPLGLLAQRAGSRIPVPAESFGFPQQGRAQGFSVRATRVSAPRFRSCRSRLVLCRPCGFVFRLETGTSVRAAGFLSRLLLTPEIFFWFSCSAPAVFRAGWSQIEARIFVSLSALPEFLFLVLDLLFGLAATVRP
jgi:hypothetical protein